MSTHVDAEVLEAGGVRVAWAGSQGEPVVTVTLDRPDKRNAQTPATWRALAAVGESIPTGTRVVVLRGAGTAFSAGIDLRTFTPEGVDGEKLAVRIAGLDDPGVAELISGFQAAFTWWHDRDDLITLAAVQGPAVGAGFQLALACDLRVAASDARFAMRETSLGLVPDLAGTHPLVRAVGYGRALELCATGRWLPAEEALRWGLVSAVEDDLDALVAATVGGLLAAPEASLRATKAVLRAALHQDAEAQRRTERETQIGLLRGLLGG